MSNPVVDNQATFTPATGSNFTLPYTCNAGTKSLVFGFHKGGTSDDLLTVKYAGVDMDLLGKVQINGVSSWVYFYGLANPAIGLNNITVTTGASHVLRGGAVSFVGGSGTFSAAVTATGPDDQVDPMQVVVPSTANQIVIAVAGSSISVTFTAGAGETERWDASSASICCGGFTEPGAVSVTIAPTLSLHPRPWGMVGVSVEESPPSASVVSVAASLVVPGRAVYGTQGGALFVTSDLLATVPLQAMAAVSSPIVDIEWDRVTTGRVWAITYDARVFVSNDYGQTWTLHSNLRTGLPARFLNRIDSVFISNALALRVFGGSGSGRPYMAWALAPSTTWTEFAQGGELAADLAGSAVDTSLYAADGASEVSTELAIILNSAAHTPAVYFTSDAFGDGATWKRGTGAPAKSRGRWLDADLDRTRFAFDPAAGNWIG